MVNTKEARKRVDNGGRATLPKELTARVDNKGRITLPKEIREIMRIKAGDIIFFKCAPGENNYLQLAIVRNPFDFLAEHAIKEYREGHTKTIEEYAQEHNTCLSE